MSWPWVTALLTGATTRQNAGEENVGNSFVHYFQVWISVSLIRELNFSERFLGSSSVIGVYVTSLSYSYSFLLDYAAHAECPAL